MIDNLGEIAPGTAAAGEASAAAHRAIRAWWCRHRRCRCHCCTRYLPVPIGMVVPLTFTLAMVDSVNAPLPSRPTSTLWPTWIGANGSQPGLVVVRLPESSAAVICHERRAR